MPLQLLLIQAGSGTGNAPTRSLALLTTPVGIVREPNLFLAHMRLVEGLVRDGMAIRVPLKLERGVYPSKQ